MPISTYAEGEKKKLTCFGRVKTQATVKMIMPIPHVEKTAVEKCLSISLLHALLARGKGV